MRHILKDIKNEPKSLKEVRSTLGSTFDDCDKSAIRQALLKEQGFLCAYCMRRISEQVDSGGKPKMKIEHYDAQSTAEDRRLNFLNMLGVCRGGEGGAVHLFHCDTSRGNTTITVDPSDEKCEQHIKYTPAGEFYSDNTQVDEDLNVTLNLNVRRLKTGRSAAIQEAKQSLKAYNAGEIKRQIKKLERLNNKGQYTEYCQAAIYILRKKLRQL
jgi:uncharacterized protein (TIGR02646 family)